MRRFGIYGSLPHSAPAETPNACQERGPAEEAAVPSEETAAEPRRESYGLSAIKTLLDRHNGIRR